MKGELLQVYDLGENAVVTYDCALLEPDAFPPDLPPVILIEFWGV